MYLILNHAKRVMDITEHAQYVRRQENEIVVGCTPEEADAIYSSTTDRFFPLEQTGYIGDSHTLVEIEAVPDEVEVGYYFYHAGEFYSTEDELARLEYAKASAAAPVAASIAFVKLVENELIDDITAAEHADLFVPWTENWTGKRGQIVRDEGVLYKAIHDILVPAQNGKPKSSPAIWKAIGDPGEEWPMWSQPIAGVDTPYMTGDKVSHNGKHWTSDIDNNVWAPGAYGWTEVA